MAGNEFEGGKVRLRAVAFHEAFGFAFEGRRRRAIFTRGEHHDVVLFGMTAEEFCARHG